MTQTHRAPGVGQAVAQTVTYVWDDGNRLTQKTLPNGVKQVFSYDGANRLLEIAYRNPDDTPIESVAYTYDAKGQRLTKSTGSAGVKDTAYTAAYDEANRMTSLTLTATGQTFLLAYDDNGNLVQKAEQGNLANVTTYTWDSRNRLIGISTTGITASFSYDGLGRRVSKTVSGQVVTYAYDGQQAVGEITNGQLSATLLTGLSLDEVIARFTTQGTRTYLTDALNSVLAQAKDDRSILNFYAYSPYGEVSTLGPDEGNPIQYTGRENDQTGLYYYRARYYDPVLKRFISEDPAGIVAGLNLQGYVGGNPVSYSDPTGEFIIYAAAIVITAAVIGGILYFNYDCGKKCDRLCNPTECEDEWECKRRIDKCKIDCTWAFLQFLRKYMSPTPPIGGPGQ